MPPLSGLTHFGGQRVHLGVCGSVAAIRAADLLRSLLRSKLKVGVTLTGSATRFVPPLTFEALGASPVFTDMFDVRTGPFGHLEPGHEARALVVAPATADHLARFAHGQADDLLSCQVLAFPGPVILAPAMNPMMWRAKATQENWRILLSRGCLGVEPEEGDTACGDQGRGRLAALDQIQLTLMRALAPQDLLGRRVLVTLGPTREPWDGVRVWTNPSTGLMGAAVAVTAWLRGAEVTVVAGPTQACFPANMTVHRVQTAQEMYDRCLDLWPGMDMSCLTAAVCDFRPKPHAGGKFKKSQAPQGLRIEFEPNPDILKRLGETKRARQRLIGFAAETRDDLADLARQKLTAKNCDLMLANRVDRPEGGFAVETNRMTVVDATGREENWPLLSKADVAWRMWDWISRS